MNLSANEKRKLRHLWKSDCPLDEIQEDMGFTAERLEEARLSLGLPPASERECKAYLPTPEEIRLAAAEIRSKWTQSEREERLRSAWGGILSKDHRGD